MGPCAGAHSRTGGLARFPRCTPCAGPVGAHLPLRRPPRPEPCCSVRGGRPQEGWWSAAQRAHHGGCGTIGQRAGRSFILLAGRVQPPPRIARIDTYSVLKQGRPSGSSQQKHRARSKVTCAPTFAMQVEVVSQGRSQTLVKLSRSPSSLQSSGSYEIRTSGTSDCDFRPSIRDKRGKRAKVEIGTRSSPSESRCRRRMLHRQSAPCTLFHPARLGSVLRNLHTMRCQNNPWTRGCMGMPSMQSDHRGR